jgi:Plasmid pRiA4b ORF-3-like protein
LRLKDFRFQVGERFAYEYDLGDGWEHELLIEAIATPEPGQRYPLCIDGERACPPEDSGGAGRYMEILEILAAPRHPEKREFKQWLGPAFDSEWFRVDEVNQRLRQIGAG